jgi:hypothetical protein
MYFSQNQQEISAIFSVVNFEYLSCYCSTEEQYFFSRMRRESSKWRGMLMHVLNKRLIEFLVAEKESLTNIRNRLKMYKVSELLTKALLDIFFSNGSTAPRGPKPPHFSSFQNYTL